MWRYIGVSIIIGLIVCTTVFLLYQTGVFFSAAAPLWSFFESSGLMPGDVTPRGPLNLLQFLMFTGLALGTSWCVIDTPRIHLSAAIAAGAIFLVLGFAFTCSLYGLYFEPFSGITAVVLSYAISAGYSRTRQGLRKRLLNAVLGSRVSPDLLLRMLGSNGDLALPQRRPVTVLTCRAFNHPDLMQKMEAEEMVEMTNLFLKSCVEHLIAKDAYIDQSRPDCVRVFFGLEDEDSHAAAACRAAIELKTRLENLNAECERRWFQSLIFGIGVSTGEVSTGIFGSEREAFFSAVGSVVGFSRRLCALNLPYGSRILIEPKCYHEAKEEFEVRPLEMIYLEDEDVMTEVYELLDDAGEMSEEHRKSRDAFWQGMIHFREGKFDAALKQFNEAKVDDREDVPLEYFIGKVQDQLVRGEGGESEEPEEGSHAQKGMIRL